MPYLVLGLALVVGLYFVFKGLRGLPPEAIARIVKWILILVGIFLGLMLAMRFGVGSILAIAALLLPLLMRWRTISNMMKGFAGPSPGQTSDVETAYLRMQLDHDTGELSGTVLRGRFQGRMLNELDENELMELFRECRVNDPQSATVLESYLDRVYGSEWRGGAAGANDEASAGAGAGRSRWGSGDRGAAASGTMTREEAYEILGLQPGASDDEIKEAHRRLMIKFHPDHGGSTYLAAKINQAKDLLLRG